MPHGFGPLTDVIGVTKDKPLLVVNFLIDVIDLLLFDDIRREEHAQLGHNDAVL